MSPGDVAAPGSRFSSKDDVVGIKVNPVGRKPLPGEWPQPQRRRLHLQLRAGGQGRRSACGEIGVPATRTSSSSSATPTSSATRATRTSSSASCRGRALAVLGGELLRTAARHARPRPGLRRPAPERDAARRRLRPRRVRDDGLRRPDALQARRPPLPLAPVADRLAHGQQVDHAPGAQGPPLGRRDAGAEEHVARHEQQRRPQPPRPASPTASAAGKCSARTSATRSSRRPCRSSGLREKATLHILDGLIGVYEGGPAAGTGPGGRGGTRPLLRHRPRRDGPRRLGHHRRQAGRGGLGAGRAHGLPVPAALRPTPRRRRRRWRRPTRSRPRRTAWRPTRS